MFLIEFTFSYRHTYDLVCFSNASDGEKHNNNQRKRIRRSSVGQLHSEARQGAHTGEAAHRPVGGLRLRVSGPPAAQGVPHHRSRGRHVHQTSLHTRHSRHPLETEMGEKVQGN